MMSLEVKQVTRKLPELSGIKEVLKTLFPAREMAPFWFLMSRAKAKYIDFLAFYDEDKFVGLSYTVTHGDLTYVLYLATVASCHSKGYGSQILMHLAEKFPNNRITLTIDEIDKAAENNAQRVRRKEFYAKNNFLPSGMKMYTRGLRFEVLVYNGETTFEDYQVIMKKLLGIPIYWFMKPKLI